MSTSSSARRIAYVVLGMHRSGTSSIAGSLVALGATPPATLMRPMPDNPLGFWESDRIMHLNDGILAAAGSDWKDWRSVDPLLLEGPTGQDFVNEAIEALLSEFGGADAMVLKDPRICRIYPFWRTALQSAGFEPIVILPVRHPDKVARSLNERNGLPMEHGWYLWLRHVLDAERDSRDDRRMIATFDSFAANWPERFASLAALSGVDLAMTDPDALAEATRFWARDVPSASVAPDDSALPELVAQAWKTFQAMSDEGGAPVLNIALDQIRDELDFIAALP